MCTGKRTYCPPPKFLSFLLFAFLLSVLLIWICPGFAKDKEVKGGNHKPESSKSAGFYPEYSALIKALQTSGIEVPNHLKQAVLKYLNSKKASSLIPYSTKREGLSWYFYGVTFLRRNLIFVSYEDGEMYGGDLLVEITYLDDKVHSMQTLWNSGGE